MSSAPRTVIIGGGISGLAAAHYLGDNAILVEASSKLGGILSTEYVNGCIVEQGADSWLASKPWAADLARELGLGSELVGSNDSRRGTFIWKHGELLEFPKGMQLVVPTRLVPILRSRLLSTSTKSRIVLDWFRRKPVLAPKERTVGSFVAEHFGMEAVDYLADPLLSGIYGGDPFELSADAVLPRLVEREHRQGSLIRGAALDRDNGPVFETIRSGLGKLIEALTPKEWIRGCAERIEPDRVRVSGDWIQAHRIIVACEGHQAAKLLPELPELQSISYSSTTAVSLGFRLADVQHPLNGFGFLVPRREGRRLTACTWMNTKFPHRVAESYVLLRCFLNSVDADDATLVETARAELRETMKVTAAPVFHTVARWHRSLPLYAVGHQKRIEALERHLLQWPGLKLIGNAYHGVGIPDCVRLAKEAVDTLTRAVPSQTERRQ